MPPYGLLSAGPLIAFGFATSLLPFLIAATLRLFDEISAREHIVKWLAITAIAGVICLVAHPRIAFTYALILVPFIVLRLPWKLILGAFIAMCVGAVAFVALMLTSFKSDRWANPASWFHSHQPSKNLWESISFCFADGLDGFPAILFALLLIAGTVAAFVCASRRTVVRFSDSLSVAVSTVAPAFPLMLMLMLWLPILRFPLLLFPRFPLPVCRLSRVPMLLTSPYSNRPNHLDLAATIACVT